MGKKILGLDLGITSIGWALIDENENNNSIIGMGSRVIPLDADDKNEFSSGNTITKNQKRTVKRTQRKGYDRYQLRRKYLTKELIQNNLFDDTLFKPDPLELWGLRAKAVSEKIELNQLGRILYHINQKRGYKSSRSDANLDKKDTEYVATVKSRHQEIKDKGISIGQKFYQELLNNQNYRIKEQVFPREAYIEEFNAILKEQSKYHSNILTIEFIHKLRDSIIFYQRPLKSQKGLVNICELAGFSIKIKDNKEKFVGPRVAPKSSPLFQLCKIWETVNNITIKIKSNGTDKYKWIDRIITIDEKYLIVTYLNENNELSFSELLKILDLKKEDVYANKQIIKGIKGNQTYSQLKKHVASTYLRFNVKTRPSKHEAVIIDKNTGEVLAEENSLEVDYSIENEPLYILWHTIYSIKESEECKKALIKNFNFEEKVAEELSKLDFTKQGFGNKSSKAMRKILPYLMKGYVYSEACSFAGYDHSNSLTSSENKQRILSDRIELLPKNSLRQPIVEKILNQSINVVNAIIESYGKPDEIRIELARQLKQSKDERNESDLRNKANEKLNNEISNRLKELGVPSSKRYVQKYKFVFPSLSKNLKDATVENICIYCGKSFSITEALTGDNFDVDHIIPKSLLFDDSQTNRVLVHRTCNATKTNQTAYDFIAKKGASELESYLTRVDDWFKRGIISYAKMNRLKVSFEEYIERKISKKETASDKRLWENFIDRQLRETQYISRKAKEIFSKVCRYVTATEGTVTAKLRELWGWDDVLMNLQLPKYREIGLTHFKEWTSDHGRRSHQKEEIIGWTKRNDHRHHAIDALVIACTKQGYIQRINTLHSSDVKDAMIREIKEAGIEFEKRKSLLEQYLIIEKPFTTQQVESKVAEIIISFKSGKKAASTGIRKVKNGKKIEIVQRGIIIPRGSLHEDGVYGSIKTLNQLKNGKIISLENAIVKKYIVGVGAVGHLFTGKEGITKKIKKDNITGEEFPVEIDQIKNTVDTIVDKGIRKIIFERLNRGFEYGKTYKDDIKKALLNFKNIETDPIFLNKEKRIPIKTVRMFTGLSAVEPIALDANQKEIGFVKPGNNHHLAFYKNENGDLLQHVCTFWHAVQRKKNGVPVIINNPSEVWDKILTNNNYPEKFLEKLPLDKWTFHESLQQNEMFVLGMNEEDYNHAVKNNTKRDISNYLYRVQKISLKGNGQIDMTFRFHLETTLNDTNEAKISKKYYNIQSIKAFQNLNPKKIRINNLGEIVIK